MVIYAHVAYYLAWPAGRRAGGFWSDYVTGDEVEYYYEIQVGCCVLVYVWLRSLLGTWIHVQSSVSA